MHVQIRRVRGLAAGVLLVTAGCTTILGTNVATDTVIASNARAETLGRVKATISSGRFFWAVSADREMYDEVKRRALQQQGGDVLLNAKIKTTLTSYFAIYYTTELDIEGTAAKLTIMPTSFSGDDLPPEPKP